jgi:hypothetical protein
MRTHSGLKVPTTTIVELVKGNYQEARIVTAGTIDRLYTLPELFEPHLEELIQYSTYHPSSVEEIPAPVDWTNDEDLQEIIFVSDAIARVAQRQPELLVPHADLLTDIVTGDRYSPEYHLFTMSMIGGVDPDAVPLDEIRPRICDLLDVSMNGYAGWAADTLRRMGNPSVLPELRENKPKDISEAQDEAEIESFQNAIKELENRAKE